MLHQLITTDTDPIWCWRTPDGDPLIIGERDGVIALYDAIMQWLDGNVGEPISEDDAAWGNHYDIGDAVAVAVEYGYSDNPSQMADTIRAAARAGRIPGAQQSETGRWSFPRRKFRGWLVASAAETRGRPRQADE